MAEVDLLRISADLYIIYTEYGTAQQSASHVREWEEVKEDRKGSAAESCASRGMVWESEPADRREKNDREDVKNNVNDNDDDFECASMRYLFLLAEI